MTVHAEEPQNAAQIEQKAIFRAMKSTAEACLGSPVCFRISTRPFGKLAVALGKDVARDDPVFASSVTNFSFGVAGAQAGVDPAGIAQTFHCGPPCAARRKKELLTALPRLRQAVSRFQTAKLSIVALWPEQIVRVDDSIIRNDLSFAVARTRVLKIWQGWLPLEGTRSMSLNHKERVGRQIAAALGITAAASVARDTTGGIRVIHRDSVGDNEAGLLFLDDVSASRIGPERQPDGGRYVFLDRLSTGVHFYIRT